MDRDFPWKTSLAIFLITSSIMMYLQDQLIPEREKYSPAKYYVSAGVSYISSIYMTGQVSKLL